MTTLKSEESNDHAVLHNLMESFVRVFPIAFDVDDFIKFASISGVTCEYSDVQKFLNECTVVYRLSDKKYLSRGKVLENFQFSIKPDKYEVEHGIVIIGDRCIPFGDPSMIPEGFSIYCKYDQMPVPRKIVDLPTGIVLDHYKLFGEEYAIQYINMDSCNRNLNLSGYDYRLPQTIQLSVLDMSDVYKKTNFQYGDRFVLSVKSFIEGEFWLEPYIDHRSNPFSLTESEEARERWYLDFEQSLMNSFEVFGPCRSIDEQLAYAVLCGFDTLSVRQCGSISEYLDRTESIAVTEFGVESRLWYASQPISVVPPLEAENLVSLDAEKNTMTWDINIEISDAILKAFVRDSLWNENEDIDELFHHLITNEDGILPEDAVRLKLRLKKVHSIIKKDYNRFTDATVGVVRHSAVNLYARLFEYNCFLIQSGVPIRCLPQ